MNPKIDVTNTILETKSLILRPFRKDDLNDFYEYAKVEGVGEMAGWSHHKSIEESMEILDMFIENKNGFAIVLKENNKVIGSIGVKIYNEKLVSDKYDLLRCREIGYVVSKEYWGRGYATEAGMAVLEYLFDELKLDAVFCGYFKRNTRSKRVIEKLGFSRFVEGIYETTYGTKEDLCLTVIHRDEWMSRNRF